MTEPTFSQRPAAAPAGLSQAIKNETLPLPPEVDLRDLAIEVLKLMKEDLRHECERQGKP